MKKLFISSFALLFAVATTQAQSEYTVLKTNSRSETAVAKQEKRAERQEMRKLEGEEVSYESKEQFYKDFGDLPVIAWERTNYFDEVVFDKDNQQLRGFYDFNSQLVGTTCAKTFADLPAKAQKTLHKKYNGFNIKEVFLFNDNEENESDIIMFGQQFGDTDSYFVHLQKGNKNEVVQVSLDGAVTLFSQLK
jgi:hypothetical protein